MNDAQITRLLAHVETLTSAGGDYNRLTMAAGEYHVIITSARDRDTVTVEVIGNRDLSRPAKLTEGRAAVVEEHGYRKSSRRPGPSKTVKIGSDSERQQLAREISDIFSRAFGVSAEETIEFAVALGDAEPTRNVELVRAMRRLAQRRDSESRVQLYQALARATYLLPLASSLEEDDPHVFETMRGRPVLGVFTDWNALRMWKPRGWPYVLRTAEEVFGAAVEHRVGALMINPRGNVGGELYLHEVEMIDRAIAKLKARRGGAR